MSIDILCNRTTQYSRCTLQTVKRCNSALVTGKDSLIGDLLQSKRTPQKKAESIVLTRSDQHKYCQLVVHETGR